MSRYRPTWIVHAERTFSERIAGPPEAVRAFYADLCNIVHIHPLVVSVAAGQREEVADGYEQRYRIRDRIAIGPLSVTFGYRARVRVPVEGDVLTEARQFPRISLGGVVSFAADGDGTRLVEHLRISAPRPLAGFTVGQAERAHRTMLRGIRTHFGG